MGVYRRGGYISAAAKLITGDDEVLGLPPPALPCCVFCLETDRRMEEEGGAELLLIPAGKTAWENEWKRREREQQSPAAEVDRKTNDLAHDRDDGSNTHLQPATHFIFST